MSHCEWKTIDSEFPKYMEIVAFWVENNIQPVPGRAYFGRYLGNNIYDLGKYIDHYIKNGSMVVTHWRRFLGPDGQSPEGR